MSQSDRPLPSAEHTERAVLGALLIDASAYERVAQRLHPDDFYQPAHRLIWDAIAQYHGRHGAVDVIGLGESLRQAGTLDQIGGLAYLEHLADTTATAAHIDEHAEIVREMSGKRRLIEMAYRLADDAHGASSVRELVAELDAATSVITRRVIDPTTMCLGDVETQPIEWLWPGRMPSGMIVILDGDPGLGKSTVTLDLAARISTGRELPDGSRSHLNGPGSVIIMSAEDDLSCTIRPRLEAAGADLTRIHYLGGVGQLPSLTDLGLIRQAVRQHGASLLIVDPLMAYLPSNVNAYRDQDIRRLLGPLALLAAELHVTILLIRHLTKSGGTHAVYRGGGSIGIIGAARSGMIITEHPEDSDKRVLAMSKANLAPRVPSLVYRLEGDPIPRVIWEGITTETATYLLELAEMTTEERGALQEAAYWLLERLREGPQSSSAIMNESKKAGIAPATLNRAKARIRIRSYRESNRWMMALPEFS